MTIPRPAIFMGLVMGLMIPWMMHMESGAGAGLAFVLAHVAAIALVSLAALFLPSVRRRAGRLLQHRPQVRHMPFMALGLAAGWTLTCAFCLLIGGTHWA